MLTKIIVSKRTLEEIAEIAIQAIGIKDYVSKTFLGEPAWRTPDYDEDDEIAWLEKEKVHELLDREDIKRIFQPGESEDLVWNMVVRYGLEHPWITADECGNLIDRFSRVQEELRKFVYLGVTCFFTKEEFEKGKRAEAFLMVGHRERYLPPPRCSYDLSYREDLAQKLEGIEDKIE